MYSKSHFKVLANALLPSCPSFTRYFSTSASLTTGGVSWPRRPFLSLTDHRSQARYRVIDLRLLKSRITSTSTATSMSDKKGSEKIMQRNPHPDFKQAEASRTIWRDVTTSFTKTRDPDWHFGAGGNDDSASLGKNHVEINPYEEGRPAPFNYKLLISAVIPRPIGFLSTRSKDGQTTNLSPFSFFQMIGYDPPLFIISFTGSLEKPKDSLRNLVESGEGVLNIISDHFIEAANSTSINAPYGVSEFVVSGLHPVEDTRHVKAPRVKEAVFSVEVKLIETKEFQSKLNPSQTNAVLVIVEGVHFWAREDAINEQRNLLDPDVLRPMSRLGGISYGRLTDIIELPRPEWENLPTEEKARFSHSH